MKTTKAQLESVIRGYMRQSRAWKTAVAVLSLAAVLLTGALFRQVYLTCQEQIQEQAIHANLARSTETIVQLRSDVALWHIAERAWRRRALANRDLAWECEKREANREP